MARSQGLVTQGVRLAQVHKTASHVEITKAILNDLFGPAQERSFCVRLWDGTQEGPATAHGESPAFTLVLRRPGALRRMLLPPSELALGEAYLRDDFDIEGEMEAATSLGGNRAGKMQSLLSLARLAMKLRALPADDLPDAAARTRSPSRPVSGRLHSRSRDSAAVRSHYDMGNDFYALWLDSRMVYSGAYYEGGAEDIDSAQQAKLEYICRKLRLKRGERLLDIGCGWGGLVLYAAEHYGVEAIGITLSKPQAELARSRIKAAGLADICRIEVCDYRDMPAGTTFDKVVSVDMFEHVGRTRLPLYFVQAYRLTRPGGLFLNHGIVELSHGKAGGVAAWAIRKIWRPGEFIGRYVLPDGELVTTGDVVQLGEMAGFETRDVESLREHCAQTFRHWVWRLEANHEEAVSVVGEKTYRVWRMYMAACAGAFAKGRIGIVQALFAKPTPDGSCELPLNRNDLYNRPLIQH